MSLLANVIARSTYKPGWKIEDRGSYLVISCEDTPEATSSYAIRDGDTFSTFQIVPIPEWVHTANEGGVIFWLRMALIEREVHEVDEWFKVDGKALFNPHTEEGVQRRTARPASTNWFAAVSASKR